LSEDGSSLHGVRPSTENYAFIVDVSEGYPRVKLLPMV